MFRETVNNLKDFLECNYELKGLKEFNHFVFISGILSEASVHCRARFVLNAPLNRNPLTQTSKRLPLETKNTQKRTEVRDLVL